MCVVFSCSKKNDKNYFFYKFQYSSKCNSEDHRLKRFLSCKTTSVIVRLPKRLSLRRDNSMIFNMQINQKYSNFSIFLGDFLTISADNNQQRLLDVTGFRSIKEEACNFIKKETLAQVVSSEFCEISKSIFLQSTSGGCFCNHINSFCYGYSRRVLRNRCCENMQKSYRITSMQKCHLKESCRIR